MWDRLKKRLELSTFIKVVQTRMTESDIGNNSVVVAYYLLFSLFPLLIAVGNILPYLKIETTTVMEYLQEMVPQQVFSFLSPAIKDLLTQSSGSLLSVSAIATIWSASQSINALQTAMNKAYGVNPRGNFIIVRLVSLIVLVFFLSALVFVTVVLGLGKMIMDYIQPILNFPLDWLTTFQTLKWPVTLIGLLVVMVLIYFMVPNAKVNIRSVLPGAVFSTGGWLLLSQAFGLYARYFAARVSGYQIIGSFIVLMLWLNLAAVIMILGGIINAVVGEYTTGQVIEERVSMLTKIKKIFERDH